MFPIDLKWVTIQLNPTLPIEVSCRELKTVGLSLLKQVKLHLECLKVWLDELVVYVLHVSLQYLSRVIEIEVV